MSVAVRQVLARLLILAAYLARPMSCGVALQLEVRPPGRYYDSVDPHGFGVLGAVVTALLLVLPVLWLLVQRREAAARARPPARTAAILLVIGMPTLIQLSYLGLPFAAAWPVIAASALWFAVVAVLCLHRVAGMPSAHGAFDRSPRLAWGVLGTIAALKMGVAAAQFT